MGTSVAPTQKTPAIWTTMEWFGRSRSSSPRSIGTYLLCFAVVAWLSGFADANHIGSSQAARAIRTAALGIHCWTSTGGLSTGLSNPAFLEGFFFGCVFFGV